MRSRILLVAALGLLVALPHASAELDEDTNAKFTSPASIQLTSTASVTGEDAEQMRMYADSDQDGDITASEEEQFLEFFRQIGAEDTDTLVKVDGKSGAFGDMDLSAENLQGPADATTAIELRLSATLNFDISTTKSSYNLTADSNDGGGTETVRVEAPPGYVFQNAKGITGATSGAVLEGTASPTVDFSAEMVKGAAGSSSGKNESPTLTGLVVIASVAALALALPRRS